ncbi:MULTISPECIES: hypothetical protein [Thiorhodovibrio]|uniref:hypothetical protein n=1 Tax=Thiorhodovibrio TaxID=61593 RepID=UPI0019144979|nr:MULTISPECIES: hypothetical protein [Thiorhodovibrio]MBK5970100.1 hypothetical protein [Thiorhodovibrio winogradskyi]WPL13482.1 hypothetical protein Thiosp_03285 [Thiorhodovibrio litoralis]
MMEGIDGIWVLVLLVCAAGLAVALMLQGWQASLRGEDSNLDGSLAKSPLGSARFLGNRKAALLVGMLGILSLALTAKFFVAGLLGGALVALAWVLWGGANWRARLTAMPGLWVQALVLVAAAAAASLALAAAMPMGAGTLSGLLGPVSRWMLSSPLAGWLAGLLLGASLIEIAGQFVGLSMPRPALELNGLALLYGGIILLLVVLAWTLGDADGGKVAEGLRGDVAARLHVTALVGLHGDATARLYGLALAVLVLGFAFQVALAATLIALKQRAGSVQPADLEELSAAEWRTALGDDPAVSRRPSASAGNPRETGEKSRAAGGNASTSGGKGSASEGKSSASAGKSSASGGQKK